jgi:hypothetical protein
MDGETAGEITEDEVAVHVGCSAMQKLIGKRVKIATAYV